MNLLEIGKWRTKISNVSLLIDTISMHLREIKNELKIMEKALDKKEKEGEE